MTRRFSQLIPMGDGKRRFFVTKDDFFLLEKEPTSETGVGNHRWYLHANGPQWRGTSDTMVGDSAGYQTKADAVEALREIYKEDNCHYFMTGDMEEAVGCSLDFQFTEEYLNRLIELDQNNDIGGEVRGIIDRLRRHQQERAELAEKENLTRNRIQAVWKHVFDNRKMRDVQKATGHDRDE